MSWTRLAASLTFAAMIGLAGCGAVVERRAASNESVALSTYPPEGQFVEVWGRKVHVVVEGQGPDLVLIHGASGNARDFTFDFADRLKHRYRLLIFDRPGLGHTEHADPRFARPFGTAAESPVLQAQMLQAAAAKLGAHRPIVLGQSYGGAVAMAWALERPDSVAALVIVSGATEPWPGQRSLGPLYDIASSKAGGAAVVPLVTAFPPRGIIRGMLSTVFAPQPVPEGYADHVGIGLALRRGTMRANARQVNNLRPHLLDMTKRYSEIDIPVEIIHGLEDVIVPPEIHSKWLAQQVPGAGLTWLPGVGHMPHHAAPDAVIAAIDRAATRAGLR